ncbi:sulfite exporter TauE/SafE family protein [Desulfuromonas sp. AOP6]|uniref:sulfite exporter TauE/SafE family protein n=1 Tax=Desulfuromonas sp. AOP6 TaxID=1566351 RepID=UPI00126A809F|nr:sulfite exporter TauE/SafE family protein [Desulfuromonas sp. AOP6]BCA79713.1 UPF0721 transmembrane protein [Desulfuromonas sp. AOP6]
MSLFSLHILVTFIVLGSCAGFLAGLLGIGGGVILVPLFLWAFPLAGFHPDIVPHLAFGTSLAIIIPTAVSSTLMHRRHGNVNWHQVVWLVAGGILGAFLGGTVAAFLSGAWLKGLFGGMLMTVALRMFFAKPYLPPERDTVIPRSHLVGVGLVGGGFSAFFGIGGGVIAVPMMVILLQMPAHLAVGCSSALIVVSSLFGALTYVVHGWGHPLLPDFSLGFVNSLVAVIIAPLSILFANLGVRVARKVAHGKLLRAFAFLLIFVGIRMVFKLVFP